jgi:hypothetical protein
MSGTAGSEFSFDLYPSVNSELDAALARNVQQGNASSELIATAGIAAAVQQELDQQHPEVRSSFDPKQSEWESQELDRQGSALDKWTQQYNGHLKVDIPGNLPVLSGMMGIERYMEVAKKLHHAKEVLTASGEVTTNGGENIGDTMHLVAVPWQAFKDHLDDMEGFINGLRRVQGINNDDYIGPNITKAISEEAPFYKSWDNPGVMYTAAEYLDYRISQDGPWGLALIQTSDDAGIKHFVGKSPDELTGTMSHSPSIAGEVVGSMGMFEWLALTLQEDPRSLSSQDYSWMLANRLDVGGGSRVPFGDWNVGQVRSSLRGADDRGERARPRLAVM